MQAARAFLPLVEEFQINGCIEGHVEIALRILEDTSISASRDVYFCNRILAAVVRIESDSRKRKRDQVDPSEKQNAILVESEQEYDADAARSCAFDHGRVVDAVKNRLKLQ